MQLCQVLARSRDTAYFPLPKPVGRVTIQTWSTVAEQRARGRLVGAVSLQRCWDQAVCQSLVQLLLSLLETGASRTLGFALWLLSSLGFGIGGYPRLVWFGEVSWLGLRAGRGRVWRAELTHDGGGR